MPPFPSQPLILVRGDLSAGALPHCGDRRTAARGDSNPGALYPLLEFIPPLPCGHTEPHTILRDPARGRGAGGGGGLGLRVSPWVSHVVAVAKRPRRCPRSHGTIMSCPGRRLMKPPHMLHEASNGFPGAGDELPRPQPW